MKKERTKGFISGMLVMALVMGLIGAAAATAGQRTANLQYMDIKITMDGQAITPTDANGNSVEPFAIDGTIYLPVRAVGNAMGMAVNWDGTTSTAQFSKKIGFSEPQATYCNIMADYKELGDIAKDLKMLERNIFIIATYTAEGTAKTSDLKSSCESNAKQLGYRTDELDSVAIDINAQKNKGTYDAEVNDAVKGLSSLRECVTKLEAANNAILEMLSNRDVLSTKYQSAFQTFLANSKESIEIADSVIKTSDSWVGALNYKIRSIT
ncbi:exported hypothetical protein [uncultured Eubacteriales bacterium]|uniref:Copper amine oxidase-like N-terminal domain-containing protein n=1 Tax=uncultured Eubacteriales bacterium TaxID=172733 RepID=A0A212JT32_9FIRM|nr:exported hypothetical protein [uncultured Eubacteriales bacterium]